MTRVCKNPLELSKTYSMIGKRPAIYMCDYEEDDAEHANAFRKHMADMGRQKEPRFIFGYSNLTFELWIILHLLEEKDIAKATVGKRDGYLGVINDLFHCSFSKMEEYKRERNFQEKILGKLSLDSVRNAIRLAGIIMERRAKRDNPVMSCGYRYYRNAPSTALGEDVFAMILKKCGLPWNLP